jgi:hypothetical protein
MGGAARAARPHACGAAAALACAALAGDARADGAGVVTGFVVDAGTGAPIADAIVRATSDASIRKPTVVTDRTGYYRIPNLPPGEYAIAIDKPGFAATAGSPVEVHAGADVRVDVALATAGAEGEAERARAPSLDAAHGTTGVRLGQPLYRALPLVRPDAKGGAARSFEAAAALAPGAHADAYGVSFGGSSSPENRYVIDGLSVNDPALGVVGTPLSMELVQEVHVVDGGFLPEHGRASGALVEVVTKSGSNALHGSVFGGFTPGSLDGSRATLQRSGTALTTSTTLSSVADAGAEVGGPIVKDRLWFYAGLQAAQTRYRLDRAVQRLRVDGATGEVLDAGGLPTSRSGNPAATDVLLPTATTYYATEKQLQYLGKLTWLVGPDSTLTLSVFGAPSTAGGGGDFSIDPLRGAPEADPSTGAYGALATRRIALSNDVALRYSTAWDGERKLFDANLGWHHARRATLPADGSALGSQTGLAGTPQVAWRRSPAVHGLDDFEPLADPSACKRVTGTTTGADGKPHAFDVTPCPVPDYRSGGPGYLEDSTLDRVDAGAVLTGVVEALGHHVVKAGVDLEIATYDHTEAYSGGALLRESTSGASFYDYRQLGFLVGPDAPHVSPSMEATTSSYALGGFVQDSWAIADVVTLEGGVRYDTQLLMGADKALGLALPNEWSPRVGVVFDPTRRGRAKLFASYARTFETIPLDLADRAFPGEPRVASLHASTAGGGLCDPRTNAGAERCLDPASPRAPANLPGDPNGRWVASGGEKIPVDPDIRPQSSDEILVGTELEVTPGTRVGVSYARRWMNQVIGVMSRDEGRTYFIGNPGFGAASDFEPARRDYDAVTAQLGQALRGGWLAQASYTVSWLRGNWSGLYRPETGQLDPNANADFDLRSLQVNRDGPLPGDQRHAIQLHVAKAFELPARVRATLGLSYRAHSGEPTSVLGAHPIYGPDSVFILPRGSGERLPWVHDVDAHAGLAVALADRSSLEVFVDVFNVFDLQAVTAIDQRYTDATVLPVPNGSAADIPGYRSDRSPGRLRNADGTPFDPRTMNPSFGSPIAFQPPRSFRFGARVVW